MKLTALEVADRLGISYVVASGLMSYLEDAGTVKVVEKKFHSSGRGKPTRIYEVDDTVAIDFRATTDVAVAVPAEPVVVEAVEPVVVEAVEPVVDETPVDAVDEVEAAKQAAIERLRAAQADAA